MLTLFKNKIEEKKIVLVILIITSLALSLTSFFKYPGIDQGVFLYTGQQLIQGEVLYRDVWDHKGPILYIIEILAIFLGGGSFKGIAIIQFAFIFSTLYILFLTLKKEFSTRVSIASSILISFILFYWMGSGNLPSVFSLLFQVASIYLYFEYKQSPKRDTLLGALCALSFFIKPTLVGTWIALYIYSIIKNILSKGNFINFFKFTFGLIVGFLVIMTPIIVYFLATNSLSQFIETFIYFNIAHANSALGSSHEIEGGIIDRFSQLANNIRSSYVVLGFLLLWFYSLILIFKEKKYSDLIFFSSVLLPIEILATNSSPYVPFKHYYITLLPTFAIIAAFYLKKANNYLEYKNLSAKFITLLLIPVCILIIIIIIKIYPSYSLKLKTAKQEQQYISEITSFVKNSSNKDDKVLVWGTRAFINFNANRKSPTKYFFQSPIFFIKSNMSDKMVETFTNDIVVNKPKYIVDAFSVATSSNLYNHATISRYEKNSVYFNNNLDSFYKYVDNNYKLIKTIGYFGIYEKK